MFQFCIHLRTEHMKMAQRGRDSSQFKYVHQSITEYGRHFTSRLQKIFSREASLCRPNHYVSTLICGVAPVQSCSGENADRFLPAYLQSCNYNRLRVSILPQVFLLKMISFQSSGGSRISVKRGPNISRSTFTFRNFRIIDCTESIIIAPNESSWWVLLYDLGLSNFELDPLLVELWSFMFVYMAAGGLMSWDHGQTFEKRWAGHLDPCLDLPCTAKSKCLWFVSHQTLVGWTRMKSCIRQAPIIVANHISHISQNDLRRGAKLCWK